MDTTNIPQTSQSAIAAGPAHRAENRTADIPPRVVAYNPDTQPPQNQFGIVRDRLFHTMLVRMALSYNRHVPQIVRRLIEFFVLLIAISFVMLLLYVHMMLGRPDASCLAHLNWPRDGVLRVEVVNNLENYIAQQEKLRERSDGESPSNGGFCPYDIKDIFIHWPNKLPKEAFSSKPSPIKRKSSRWGGLLSADELLFSMFLKPDKTLKQPLDMDEISLFFSEKDGLYVTNDSDYTDEESEASFEYVVEYSLHYGLLRLPHSYRLEHNIPFLLVRLDPETHECFGDWMSRKTMKYLIGYEDVLMSSVKALAENESDKGYLRDMITGEHYRFVTMNSGKMTYITALFVMLIFTFVISILLRFSHHQIFLFIVDLLQMFEFNQAFAFPAAPLLTVILALVGMEAIMSEVFNDTSTAFYVILLVWIADQYDAICCRSPISKRHWLRFFYLFHYAFYAYQYRYNGQYGGIALLASTFFILHSMIFFFHHYELPLILYHDRLHRIISDIQHNPNQVPIMGGVAPENDAAAASEPNILNNSSQLSHELRSRDVEVQQPAASAPTDNVHPSSSGSDDSNDTRDFEHNQEPSEESSFPIRDPLIAVGERLADQILENAIPRL